MKQAELYNDVQSSLRVHVEIAFGILKNRWRILKCVQAQLKNVDDIILACAVLHNYTILHQDIWAPPVLDSSDPDYETDPDTFRRVGQARLPDWVTACPGVKMGGRGPLIFTAAFHRPTEGVKARDALAAFIQGAYDRARA